MKKLDTSKMKTAVEPAVELKGKIDCVTITQLPPIDLDICDVCGSRAETYGMRHETCANTVSALERELAEVKAKNKELQEMHDEHCTYWVNDHQRVKGIIAEILEETWLLKKSDLDRLLAKLRGALPK